MFDVFLKGLTAGLFMGAIGIIYALVRLIINKLLNRKNTAEIKTKSQNRIIGKIKGMANKKRIIVLVVVSTILVWGISFLTINAYQYYYHQNYIINLSDENAKNTLHTKDCVIIKGNNNIKTVTETDIAEGFIEAQYNFCTLCKPQPPSLSSIKMNLSNCKNELNKLMVGADKDKDTLDKNEIAIKETSAERSELESTKEYIDAYERLKSIKTATMWDFVDPLHSYDRIYGEKCAKYNITEEEVNNAKKRVDRKIWLNNHIVKVANYLNQKMNIFY